MEDTYVIIYVILSTYLLAHWMHIVEDREGFDKVSSFEIISLGIASVLHMISIILILFFQFVKLFLWYSGRL